MLDQGTGGGKSARVAGLGQDRRRAHRRQSGDRGDQISELKLIEHLGHPRFGVGELGGGGLPVLQQERDPLQRTAAVCDHTCGVGQRGEQVANDAQRSPLSATAGDLTPCGLLEPDSPRRRVRARSPPSRSQITPIAAAHVCDRNGCRAHSSAAGQTHSSNARICWTCPTISRTSCSRRAPRCRNRPHVSSTGSGT